MSELYEKRWIARIESPATKPRQPKLTIEEQLNHLANDHGVSFKQKGIKAAEKFLSNNNYYHKIKAYAKNFSVYEKKDHPLYSKYCDLDFEYLVELSIIDMRLRRIIIEMSLDIEHFLKVQLINDITNNSNEDAYNIVKTFLNTISFEKKEEISNKLTNYYCERYNHHDLDNIPAWELVEILSFGDFVNFYELYYTIYPSKSSMINNLKPVQWLRNAAAHNNCIINDLTSPSVPAFEINMTVNNFISKIQGISDLAREKKLSNKSMHDFMVLLYVFNKVVNSEKVKNHSMENLKNFVYGRMIDNKNYFYRNALLQSNYAFLKKVVDYYTSNVV